MPKTTFYSVDCIISVVLIQFNSVLFQIVAAQKDKVSEQSKIAWHSLLHFYTIRRLREPVLGPIYVLLSLPVPHFL